MDDLISRQATIKLLEEWAVGYSYLEVPVDSIADKLNELPTAEKKGEWKDYCGGVICDQCGFECDDTYYLGEANFCPNCGARMEN